jgi:imidazolonepropionase
MKSKATIFENINELFTFQGFADKAGRRPLEKDYAILKNASMVSSGGRIEWVGPSAKLPAKFKKAKRVSLRGKAVFPAFTECHTHIVFAGERADEYELRQTGMTYSQISESGGGIKKTVLATRKRSIEDLKKIAEKRLLRFLAQGVTTVESKSGYGLDFKSEKKILLVNESLNKNKKNPRVVSTYLGPHSRPPENQTLEEYLEKITSVDLQKIYKEQLACRADIFIERGFFEKEMALKYLKRAKEIGFDLAIHADQLSHSGGTQLGIDFGARSVDHLVHIQEGEIQALAKSSTTGVALPASDFYLKINYPPARAMIDAGVRVALATDFNPGSSPTQDLAFVGLLARQEMKMTLPEVFSGYTVAAAHALGLENVLGSLSVGKRCDFFVTEASPTDFFYHVGETPVETVYREGLKIFG